MNEITRYKAFLVDADHTINEQAYRITTLEATLRQAREALVWASDLNDVATKYQPLKDTLAAIDAVLPGAPKPTWNCIAHPKCVCDEKSNLHCWYSNKRAPVKEE